MPVGEEDLYGEQEWEDNRSYDFDNCAPDGHLMISSNLTIAAKFAIQVLQNDPDLLSEAVIGELLGFLPEILQTAVNKEKIWRKALLTVNC